jgi:hypothetical protein
VRRILLLVAVALVMAALVVLASPAFAAPGGQGDEQRAMPRETGRTPSNAFHAIGESAPPGIPPGERVRPESVQPHAPMPFTGPPPQTYD